LILITSDYTRYINGRVLVASSGLATPDVVALAVDLVDGVDVDAELAHHQYDLRPVLRDVCSIGLGS
jgi:hypothetical protein